MHVFAQGSSSDEALTHIGSQELSTDTGYFSQSPSQQLQFVSRTGGSTQQTTPQTPQTPNSIPEIVLSGDCRIQLAIHSLHLFLIVIVFYLLLLKKIRY